MMSWSELRLAITDTLIRAARFLHIVKPATEETWQEKLEKIKFKKLREEMRQLKEQNK